MLRLSLYKSLYVYAHIRVCADKNMRTDGTIKLWCTINSPDILDADRQLQTFSTVEFTSGLQQEHIYSAFILPSKRYDSLLLI